jgi:very-short-patch-repair endonuclease
VLVAERLVIEADSWRHHRSREAFENDRRRDAVLLRAGYRTLRVTDRQLTGAPHDVAATLQAVLRAA